MSTNNQKSHEAASAASLPNVKDEPRPELAPEPAKAGEVTAQGVGSGGWLGGFRFLESPYLNNQTYGERIKNNVVSLANLLFHVATLGLFRDVITLRFWR